MFPVEDSVLGHFQCALAREARLDEASAPLFELRGREETGRPSIDLKDLVDQLPRRH